MGTALPSQRFTQAERFAMIGYSSEWKKNYDGDIETRHFYLEGRPFNPHESKTSFWRATSGRALVLGNENVS